MSLSSPIQTRFSPVRVRPWPNFAAQTANPRGLSPYLNGDEAAAIVAGGGHGAAKN